MQRYTFKMFLDPGRAAECRARRDAIWPELLALLRRAGVSDSSIDLDAETGILFAHLERRDDQAMDASPAHPEMRRWWDHMKDIMRTLPDGSPAAGALEQMFHLD